MFLVFGSGSVPHCVVDALACPACSCGPPGTIMLTAEPCRRSLTPSVDGDPPETSGWCGAHGVWRDVGRSWGTRRGRDERSIDRAGCEVILQMVVVEVIETVGWL